MGAAMPDAYRVGSGSVTPDYPGGMPTPLADRPVLPAEASALTAEPTKQAFTPAPEAPTKDGSRELLPSRPTSNARSSRASHPGTAIP